MEVPAWEPNGTEERNGWGFLDNGFDRAISLPGPGTQEMPINWVHRGTHLLLKECSNVQIPLVNMARYKALHERQRDWTEAGYVSYVACDWD